MAQEQLLISSDWGNVTAELVDNEATRSLIQMLPLTVEMHDHLRQEKTGNLLALAGGRAATRFLDRHTGTWSSDHFVIYYRVMAALPASIILLAE